MCKLEATKEKKYARKVLLINGYSINKSGKLTDGSEIIFIHLSKRIITLTVNKDYIVKERHTRNPIYREKVKVIRWS